MDLIKLSSQTAQPTELSVGEIINGWTSCMWVERYREPGEFKIEAPLSSGLKELLPIEASFVTHLETSVVMMVEDHNIEQPKGKDPKIVVTGRCLTAFLENRTLGDGEAYANLSIGEYFITANPTWEQAVVLISVHVTDPINTDDELVGVSVGHTCSGVSTSEQRLLKYQSIDKVVSEILKVDDLGIKSVRPTPTEPLTYYIVYRGNDVSTKVRFSWMRGDFNNVEYLFSNKRLFTQAHAMGKWVQVMVSLDPSGDPNNYYRRTMLIDMSDIDQQQSSMPTGLGLDWIEAGMSIRAHGALRAQQKIVIVQADVSDNTQYRYRRDYNLGDLVTVDGDFGSSQVMRVTEYAETEDEKGVSGHPTLSIPGEE